MKVCIIGASGKLGRYMVQHALDRGYEVVGVCRERSVEKLDQFKDRIAIVRRRANRAGTVGRSSVLIRNSPGGARLRAPGRSLGVFLRMAHHSGWSGRIFS